MAPGVELRDVLELQVHAPLRRLRASTSHTSYTKWEGTACPLNRSLISFVRLGVEGLKRQSSLKISLRLGADLDADVRGVTGGEENRPEEGGSEERDSDELHEDARAHE